MITVPLVLVVIVAVIAYFAIRSGYGALLFGTALVLFGFILRDTSAGASISQWLDHIRN
ncbi:hypothetical protein [Catenulispora pinisilvae]|nr:hypothetical protein [Catenulispora pinisilvae]